MKRLARRETQTGGEPGESNPLGDEEEIMSEQAQKGRITVVQAAYGAVQGSKVVTAIVQDLVDQGITSFKCDNATLGGDPAKGHDKHFAMNYRVGSSIFTAACKENETVTLKTDDSPGDFTVVGAAYGTINPSNPVTGSRDVTAIVQQILDSGQTELEPNNTLFGDPFKGPRKNFGMTYHRTGDSNPRKAIASNEGQKVTVS